MSLETGTFISDLVAANPTATDPKSEGDDHLRLLKNTIKNTFPNVNAAVNATPAQMNALVGNTTLITTLSQNSPDKLIGTIAGTDTITGSLTPALTAYTAGQVFYFVAAGANTTTTPTININSLGAKSIKRNGTNNLNIGDIASGSVVQIEYDGTNFQLLGGAVMTSKIQPISATVAANALTISASTMTLDFRSTTLGSGTVTTVTGTPANLVVPSTATLGTTSAVASRLVVLAMNNAGTIELAVVNIAGNTDISETGLISTTVIAAGSNTANIVYSTTARTSLAYRVLGYIDSTQATAGTWATAPSAIQGAGGANVTMGRQMVLGTAVATTSGTSITFSSIPSWVKRITVMLNNVSTSGTSPVQVQLGAGSVTTTGYNGAATYEGASTSLGGNSTTGLLFDPNIAGAAATQRFGIMTICNFGSNTWVASMSLGRADAFTQVGGGSVTLGGTLDRVVLTTVGGTDTFDLGSVNILWE